MNKIDISNAFNDYFVEFGENLVSRLPEVDAPLTREIIPDCCIWLYPTNEDEVSEIIMNLANKHSAVARAISNVILKSTAHASTGTLVKMISYTFVTRVCPEQLAVAKVIPLF